MTTKLSVRDVPAIQSALRAPVKAALMARAVAEVERERADKRQRAILAAGDYRYGEMAHDGRTGQRVTDPKDAWLMNDDNATRYYAECDKTRDAEGYTGLKPGYCPALVAEHAQTKAENAVVEASRPWFGVDVSGLLCGTKTEGGVEVRQRFLDLLIGLVVKAGREG